MEDRVTTQIKKLRPNLGLTSAIVALSVGVILPVLLSTSLGIVTLAIGEGSGSILLGVLIISFAAAATGGAAVVTVLLGRRARIARLEADLLANVTHELRTPLASIRMFSQTLQMGRVSDDPKRTAECVETILRETEWLEAMIDRVLTWRGSAKDRSTLNFERAQVNAAVEEAVDRFTRMIAPGEVDFSISMKSSIIVFHDKQAIAAIVLNLLVNAYKYTRSKKKISVTVEDMKNWVEVAVEDNGIGVPPKEAERIFDPFYRVDSRLRGNASGAGLGLAIVRHGARAHSGEVYVASEEGQGSRFLVRLPAAVDEEPI
ncbi:MAG: HAMP domain-containing histidine kinase [Deltaproteobacteria bacterium]|nr:HAMP domain-containing histidine kinase [Deltaproteobacteria bacterium]